MLSVALMVAIHAIRLALPDIWDEWILGLFAFAPDRYLPEGGDDVFWPGGVAAALWSPFTYALLHNDLLHLISNCAVFAALGNVLARRMTAGGFLLFCLITAPLAAIGELIIAVYQSAPVIGVSGVICAMMGGLARILPEPQPQPQPQPRPSPPPVEATGRPDDGDGAAFDAPPPPERPQARRLGRSDMAPVLETLRRPRVIQFIGAFAVMNLVLVFAAPMLVGGGAGVAWMVHVAGFIAGFLLFPWFEGRRGVHAQQ